MNLLFTNAGRRTYIIDYALKLKKKINVYITETEKYTPVALHNKVRKFFTIKVADGPNKYLKQILNIVLKNKIKTIIPLSDHDLVILAKNKNFFAKFGCDVIVSDLATVKNCVNKKLMYKHCIQNKINTPKSFFSKKTIIGNKNSLIKKKIKGSGGVDMELIKNEGDLNKINFKKYFVQKKIQGEEFGVDIFSMKKNKTFRICIKKKILMRSGETDRSLIVDDKKITNFCKKIEKYFPIYGNLDCDLIKNKRGKIYLIDLNPRFGGGYPATHESGLKFLYHIINKKFKIPRKPIKKIISKGINIFSKKLNK